MIDHPPEASLLRWAATRGGAVARVGAVGQAERSRPVDPARITDPRWTDWPRPDPAQIAIGDITQFQGLVYGPAGRPLPSGEGTGANAGQAASLLAHGAATQGAGTAAPLQLPSHAPPADRITSTLQHLRMLRGL